jgi:hypothetical protein
LALGHDRQSTAEPIIDLRPTLDWKTRLPAQLLTVGLWGLGLYLAAVPLSRLPGRLATAAALTTATGLPLAGLVSQRSSRITKGTGSQVLPIGADLPGAIAERRDPPRQELAASVGIDEASLFRGRHARICTVHHNSAGEVEAIQVCQPMMGFRLPSRDAHPVG